MAKGKNMKPFSITTPVLKRRRGPDSYYLGNREMLCREILASLFEIGEHEKISLLLSSEKNEEEDEESVAIVFKKSPYPMYSWRKKGQRRWAIGGDLFFDADQWLVKKSVFRDMAAGGEITVHVTVYLID